MKKSGASQGQSASELISKRIADLGDWRGKTLARMRTLIKEADPGVVEEWKWVKANQPWHPGLVARRHHLHGRILRAGKNQIGLSQDDWKKGRDRKKGVGMRVFMSTTQNVDEIAARARSAGVKLDSEPHDTEWKSRAFEVTDPSGFLLTISSEGVA
jgi:hypothetical protein